MVQGQYLCNRPFHYNRTVLASTCTKQFEPAPLSHVTDMSQPAFDFL
jgi:hypothetical protein